MLAGVEEGVGGGLVLLDSMPANAWRMPPSSTFTSLSSRAKCLVMTSPSSTATRSAGGT